MEKVELLEEDYTHCRGKTRFRLQEFSKMGNILEEKSTELAFACLIRYEEPLTIEGLNRQGLLPGLSLRHWPPVRRPDHSTARFVLVDSRVPPGFIEVSDYRGFRTVGLLRLPRRRKKSPRLRALLWPCTEPGTDIRFPTVVDVVDRMGPVTPRGLCAPG